jgi:hypothetical protein
MYCVSNKPIFWLKNSQITPIYVGSLSASIDGLNDRNGDSIWEKNASYCELTAMYWIWKNIIKKKQVHEPIGFCHYRRFFSPSQNFWGTIHEVNSVDYQPYYEKIVQSSIDAILPNPITTRVDPGRVIDLVLSGMFRYPYQKITLREHYEILHIGDDLSAATALLPAFLRRGFEEHLDKSVLHPCNMVIAQPNILDDYFSILFNWLEKVEAVISLSGRTACQKRVFGFLAERFCSFFFSKLLCCSKSNVILLKSAFGDRFEKRNIEYADIRCF